MRPRAVFLIAGRELREALRTRWFLLAAGSFLVLSLGLAWMGLAGAERSGLAGFDRTTASLLNLMLLFVPLVTIPLGGLTIAGELEDGALAMLLAQPVTRAEVWTGKYLGLVVTATGAILTGFGITGVLVGARAGGDARAFLALTGLVVLLAAAMLALGMALSVALGSRSRVMGAAFASWLVLVYLSDLGSLGLVIARHLRPGQVFALGLLNPVTAARVLGTLALSQRLDVLGPAGLFGVDRFGVEGTVMLLIGMLTLAVFLPLAAGYAAFRHTVVS